MIIPLHNSVHNKANSVKNLETPEAKLGWMFDAYDADGGGSVDNDEITNIVVGLFRLDSSFKGKFLILSYF